MELNTDTFPALEQIPSPAFWVRDGKIVSLNSMARNRQFALGADIDPLLQTGSDEYRTLVTGQLSVILRCNDIPYDTTVIRQGQDTLFVLSSEYDKPELQALSLAAQYLRDPLSCAMEGTELLLPMLSEESDPALRKQLLQINRSLYRLQRAISNMADTAKYQRTTAALELRDAVAILSEIMEKASVYLERSGKKLAYTLPKESVYTLVNAELLERGVLNLISNAAKRSSDDTVCISVSKTERNLCITVQNACSSTYTGNLFERYLRQPDMEDGKNGIGLGLSIVRSCAYTHGGTVLTDLSDSNVFKITMSLNIRCVSDRTLRTPVQLPYDYAGSRDHTLLELSDVLSPDSYDQ